MKQNTRLTKEQQELVENHLYLVYWTIKESIHVNETIYGFGYEDLYQEGCIWLCHAAATYDPARSRFPTYAKKIVRNGLLSYCRQTCSRQNSRRGQPVEGMVCHSIYGLYIEWHTMPSTGCPLLELCRTSDKCCF